MYAVLEVVMAVVVVMAVMLLFTLSPYLNSRMWCYVIGAGGLVLAELADKLVVDVTVLNRSGL
jgi:hypothetical protein